MHTYVHIRIYTHIHIRMYASTCHYYYIFDNYICTHRAQVPCASKYLLKLIIRLVTFQ